VSLLVAASTSALEFASIFVGGLGICAGSVYVLGFTLLHESVDDELRGRIFSALYTLVRFCVLIAFVVGPFLAGALEKLSTNAFGTPPEVTIAGVSIGVPGVRLTLWLAGLIIIGAGILATMSLRAARAVPSVPRTASALDELLLQEGAELVSGLTGPITEVRRSYAKGEPPPPPDLAVAPDPPEDPDE
jgi:MFS family permease